MRYFFIGLLSIILAVSCGERPDFVSWPLYRELPQSLKSSFPKLADGAFATEDGRRSFLIGVYSQDDPRFDLYGKRELTHLPPDYGLYDPNSVGWIYEEPLDGESFRRLGFNLYSITLTPKPFYNLVGYQARVPQDPEYVRVLAREMRAPFYVDYVAWPWTLGAPGQTDAGALPPEAINPHRNHWVPFRTIGEGREIWLQIWRLYAERLRDANVPVLLYELFNEPIYGALTEDHRDEFVLWLKARYGTLEKVNKTWAASYDSWGQIRNHPSPMSDCALWLDYDEYLGDTFVELFAAGRDAIREFDADAVCVVQPTKRLVYDPLCGVDFMTILDKEEVVLAPTDGGVWTPGEIPQERPASLLDCPLASAPISSDLMCALAGERMLFDNELYLTGQTRRTTRNDFWTRVLLGYDGATLFSWSKRGWAWWDGKRRLEKEAESHPYSALLPLARNTEALRGILDFALEIEKVRDDVLPKPWNPDPKIGFLWNWGDVRRRAYDRKIAEKTMEYYAALRYSHWPMTLLPSNAISLESLSTFEVLVVAGMEYLREDIAELLIEYTVRGGQLVVAATIPSRTPYGPPNNIDNHLSVRFGEKDTVASTLHRSDEVQGDGLPDEIDLRQGVRTVSSTQTLNVLLRDARNRPVLVEQPSGKGRILYQAADIHGYRLVTVLSWLLEVCGIEKPVSIHDSDGVLATNILLSYRRYEDRVALLLRNRNRFPQRLRISLALGSDEWSVCDPLDTGAIRSLSAKPTWTADQLKRPGIPLDIDTEDFRLLLIERGKI